MIAASLSTILPPALPMPDFGVTSLPAQRPKDFQAMLRAAGVGRHRGAEANREEAREAVSQLVSAALVQPALASLRGGAFMEGPMAPGMAERRFGPLLDREIADRVVHAANFPLIDAILDRLPLPSTKRTTSGGTT